MKLFEKIKSDLTYLSTYSKLNSALKTLDADAYCNITTDFEKAVDKYPMRLAVEDETRCYSYWQFEQRANKFAAWALWVGLNEGDTVALFMENRVDYIAFWYGMAKVGVKTALINNNLSGESLAHCIKCVSARALIASATTVRKANSITDLLDQEMPIWTLSESGIAENDLESALEGLFPLRPFQYRRKNIKGGDTALYIFTSGTTGLPKAVKMTHVRCIQMMRAFVYPCRLTEKDRVFLTLPMYHGTGGVCGAGSALISGAALVIRNKFSAKRFWQDATRSEVTAFVYVGELNRYLMNNEPCAFEKKHQIGKIFGNGMRADVWETFITRTGIKNIYEFYGSSEGNVSLFNMDAKIGAIGRIPPFLKSKIPYRLIKVDMDTLIPLRDNNGLCIEALPGEVGEIVGRIERNNVSSHFEGYQSADETSAKVLRDVFEVGDRYFRSGDALKQDERGYFYFVDRLGDTFRWKSENISSAEVEEAICRVAGIDTAIVYGVEIPGNDGRAGMATITVSEIDLAEFYKSIAKSLPSYARPVFLRVSQQQESTGTMKFKKNTLKKQGYQLSQVNGDGLFVISVEDKTYVELNPEIVERINAGAMRF